GCGVLQGGARLVRGAMWRKRVGRVGVGFRGWRTRLRWGGKFLWVPGGGPFLIIPPITKRPPPLSTNVLLATVSVPLLEIPYPLAAKVLLVTVTVPLPPLTPPPTVKLSMPAVLLVIVRFLMVKCT